MYVSCSIYKCFLRPVLNACKELFVLKTRGSEFHNFDAE